MEKQIEMKHTHGCGNRNIGRCVCIQRLMNKTDDWRFVPMVMVGVFEGIMKWSMRIEEELKNLKSKIKNLEFYFIFNQFFLQFHIKMIVFKY